MGSERETATSVRPLASTADLPIAKAGRQWHFSRQQATGYLFVAPALLFLLVLIGYPLFTTFRLSFTDIDPRTKTQTFVGIQHYIALVQNNLFWQTLKNTVVFTIASTIGHILIGLMFALLLNEKWANTLIRNFTRGLLILPWLFSMAAAALMWSLLYQAVGPINYLLEIVGLTTKAIDFLGDRNFAMGSLVFVNIWKYFPFYMVIILGALQSISQDLYDAAHVDGANRVQRFRFITLPMIRPFLVTLALIDLISTTGVFDVVRLLTNGGPVRSTQTIAYYIWEIGFRDVNYGLGSAMSVVMLLIIGFGTFLYVRIAVRRQ